jgi:hypothetical protein
MNSDDRLIVDYLKSWPRHFVSAREIARRAGGKRRYRDEPQWAFPILTRLVEQEMIETDGLGHYRLVQKMVESKKRRRWVSPQMRRILERSGKNFGEVLDIPEDEKEIHEK